MTAVVAELLDAVTAFDLGAPTGAPTLAARGAMGEVYRLDTARGAFAVKRLFDWNPGDGAAAEAEFTAAARKRGVATPTAIAARDGAYVAETSIGRLRAFTWVDVGPATPPPRPVAVLREFGQVMGRLHDIAPASDRAVDDWYLRPPPDDAWASVIEAASAAALPWASSLRANQESIARAAGWARSSIDRPARVCHRDLDPTNVLPDARGGLVVLDWENLGPLPPDREVGVALFDWTADGPQQREQAAAIRAAYLAGGGKVRELEPASFGTLFATNVNHLHMQVRAVLDPATTDSDLGYAHAMIPRLIPQPRDFDRIDELMAAWNAA